MTSSNSRRQRSALRSSAAGLALIVALGGCGKRDEAAQTDSAAAAPEQQQAAGQPAVSAKVSAMGADQLRSAASAALREQRLYSPAADNAMEYYLALRDKQPNDAAVASALTDLMPYILIATEQSITRDDFAEAQRLYGLMEKADAQAPALPRLKQGITDAQAALARRTADAETQSAEEIERQAALEKQRAVEQERAQQQAAAQLQQQASAQGTEPPPAAPPAAAPVQAAATDAAADAAAQQRAADAQAAERRAAEQRQAQQAAATEAAAPPAAAAAAPPAAVATALRAVSTPAPDYPPAALRAGDSGEVVVEFTVNPDGSVGNPRVVRSSPPRVFDRAALNAVRRWRYQPVATATTTRRTIGFTPGR